MHIVETFKQTLNRFHSTHFYSVVKSVCVYPLNFGVKNASEENDDDVNDKLRTVIFSNFTIHIGSQHQRHRLAYICRLLCGGDDIDRMRFPTTRTHTRKP